MMRTPSALGRSQRYTHTHTHTHMHISILYLVWGDNGPACCVASFRGPLTCSVWPTFRLPNWVNVQAQRKIVGWLNCPNWVKTEVKLRKQVFATVLICMFLLSQRLFLHFWQKNHQFQIFDDCNQNALKINDYCLNVPILFVSVSLKVHYVTFLQACKQSNID